MNRAQNNYRNDAIILQRLSKGPATTSELAKAVYGDSDYHARRTLWVAIHRLRKRGVTIDTETAGDWKKDWQTYKLTSPAPCPYCAGCGVIAPEEPTP
jgi:hypothetical protein